ncbi:fucose 4-O-acetylase-like acetyltransferase [Promicromonospora sp. AC04]|uniref:acyltransferase family protein n=1 Tax=Promicromonospora sp. AC04 TaxID=2135723 RepID=UPI000D38067F|nr:acyltransferase [Promicromonospora sp. AC04]PUB24431.1 fucose 4-O-acetylase-like acetyltransferase [Promicromonospora sp. AC04]
MTTTAARPTTTRLGYVDNLRILLTVLVLAHHSAVTYGALPIWYWTEPSDSPSGIALMLFVIVNQFYFMGFFFLLSGLFTPGSVDRKGPGAFARDRLIRLGVPLVAFWLVARPVLSLPQWPDRRAQGESFLQFWFTVGDVGPLWFVEVLLVMSLAYAAFRALRARSAARTEVADAGARTVVDAEPRPVSFRTIAGLVALLTVVSFLWRLVVPTGTYWTAVGLPSPAYLPQYVILFVVGLLATRRGWLAALTGRQGRVALVVALVSVGLALGTVALATAPGAGALALLGASLAENVFAVSAIVALLVLFREKFSGQPAWARLAAQNSFAVYVIHPLVLVGVAMLFAPLVAPAGVKFLILMVLAVPLCWGFAYLLRRIPGVARVL